MNYERKISLLTGWGRYLCRAQDLRRKMERIEKIRKGGNFGIKIHDDDWALVWQRLDFRLHRAMRAFNPVSGRTYSFTGDGPLTLEIFPGVTIPGWSGKTEAEYATENAQRFDESYRQRAVRAKQILIERHGVELGEPAFALLDKHDYEETLNEAYQ